MFDISVKITVDDISLAPVYSSDEAAGADLKAAESGIIASGEYKLIKTGVKMELPKGYEGQVRPRSGLAAKFGVTMLNSPGTIDSDYRGEIAVIMINHGKSPFQYTKGDRIAQLVIGKHARCKFDVSENLSNTRRGDGGFGHTGVK